jgi:hypothetical protein
LKYCASALLAAITCLSLKAQARPSSRGFFSELGLGAVAHIGAARHSSSMGPAVDLRAGYDLFSWLSLGAQFAASSHEATVPPPPTDEWYQLYRGCIEVRLAVPAGAVNLFAEGGLGGAWMSSNVLGQVGIVDPDESVSLALSAGGGLEYQLRNRHYALGLAGDWWLLPSFAQSMGVEGRLYLRYTY